MPHIGVDLKECTNVMANGIELYGRTGALEENSEEVHVQLQEVGMSFRVLRSHGSSMTALARESALNLRTVRRDVESEEPCPYPEPTTPPALTTARLVHVRRRFDGRP